MRNIEYQYLPQRSIASTLRVEGCAQNLSFIPRYNSESIRDIMGCVYPITGLFESVVHVPQNHSAFIFI